MAYVLRVRVGHMQYEFVKFVVFRHGQVPKLVVATRLGVRCEGRCDGQVNL